MRVLGIDPGSAATGFGVVERADGTVRHVAHGTLRPPRGAPLPARLAFLYEGAGALARMHEADCALVERVFVAANPRSALVLGQARGAVLAALHVAGLRVRELTAREVKQAVVGSGAAAKSQVQAMVQRELALEVRPGRDAADALALAICGAWEGRLRLLDLPRRGRRRTPGRAPALAARRTP